MNKTQMSLRMPELLMAKLNEYAQNSGLSKTEIVVRAIASYLNCDENISLHQRMTKVEQRMANLEIILGENNQN